MREMLATRKRKQRSFPCYARYESPSIVKNGTATSGEKSPMKTACVRTPGFPVGKARGRSSWGTSGGGGSGKWLKGKMLVRWHRDLGPGSLPERNTEKGGEGFILLFSGGKSIG